MRGAQWAVVIVLFIVWLAVLLLDVGGSSVHALLAMAIIVLCIFIITGRTRRQTGD